MDESSRKLSTPRTGSQILTRVNGKAVETELILIAAWQSTEPRCPKRCVVRCDGLCRTTKNEVGGSGFPCGVLLVDYTIGGLSKSVLVDAQCQSALVLWAESIEVRAAWDERRVTRLATVDRLPWASQSVAASINSDANLGDQGPADARWLDMLAVDATGDDDDEWSIHPIPEGARGVRFLNALASGANVETADTATLIVFSADMFASYPTGIVETAIDGLTDQAVVMVPAGARFLFVQFPAGTIAGFDEPSWLEWVMSPNSLFGG